MLRDLGAIAEKGNALAAEIMAFSDRVSQASANALRATNPALVDTDLGGEWPFVSGISLESMLIDGVKTALELAANPKNASEKKRTHSTTNDGRELLVPSSIINAKYSNGLLADAYASGEPRQRLAKDLATWAEHMEQDADCALLVMIEAGSGSRVEVNCYEDTPEARTYFEASTDGNLVTEEDAAGGHKPDQKISDRVILSGAE